MNLNSVIDLIIELKYEIKCEVCRKSYVGESKRRLFKRMLEHQANKNNVINQHCSKNNHYFNFSNPKILDIENKISKRKVSEMTHISLQDNRINLQTDTKNFFSPYLALVKNVKIEQE